MRAFNLRQQRQALEHAGRGARLNPDQNRGADACSP